MIVENNGGEVLVAAKKVEDAIKEGLETLGVGLDEVKVEVVESGGLFRKAKVKLTLEGAEPKPAKEEKPKEEKAKEPKEEKIKAEKADKLKEASKLDKPKEETKPAKEERHEKDPQKTVDKVEKAASSPKQKQAEAPAEGKRSKEAEKAAHEKALSFIKETVKLMGFDVQVEEKEQGVVELTAPAGDDSLLIGKHGETLAALSYLAETGARAEKCRISVTVDCNGYRGRRAASLSAMARRRADECVAKRRKIKLEPMERVDRRTIHNALGEDGRVTTASEGKEPYRYVVIYPKTADKGAKRVRSYEE